MTDFTPPPQMSPTVPPQQTTWPTVIGIIAIVFASLALLQNGLCVPVGLAMSGAFKGMMEDLSEAAPQANMDVQVAQFEAMGEYLPHQLILALAAAVVAAILLVGGIRLVRRRASSKTTIRVWAVLKIVLSIPVAWVGYLAGRAQFVAMADAAADSTSSQPQMPPGFFNMLESFGPFFSIVTLLWMWALPLFIMVWFAKRRIREEVAGWDRVVSEQ